MLMDRGTLPSDARQRKIQIHGRQRQLAWHNNKMSHEVDDRWYAPWYAPKPAPPQQQFFNVLIIASQPDHMAHADDNQGWRQEFSYGGLTLPTRGLKYGFQGTSNTKNLVKSHLIHWPEIHEILYSLAIYTMIFPDNQTYSDSPVIFSICIRVCWKTQLFLPLPNSRWRGVATKTYQQASKHPRIIDKL